MTDPTSYPPALPPGQPIFVGPPPLPPREPKVYQANHILHLLMTVLTVGLWVVIWGMAAMNASAATDQERKRYAADMERYAQEYDEWQRRYVQAYGTPPMPR